MSSTRPRTAASPRCGDAGEVGRGSGAWGVSGALGRTGPKVSRCCEGLGGGCLGMPGGGGGRCLGVPRGVGLWMGNPEEAGVPVEDHRGPQGVVPWAGGCRAAGGATGRAVGTRGVQPLEKPPPQSSSNEAPVASGWEGTGA